MTFTPTTEQQNILTSVKENKNTVVIARAGTGKTTTCLYIANNVKKRGLYIAFNAAIAKEAVAKFPEYVECKTIHSLAWREIIKNTRSKMAGKLKKGFLSSADINLDELDYIISSDDNLVLKEEIKHGVKMFCQSAATTVREFLTSCEDFQAILKYWQDRNVDFVKFCEVFWEKLINEKNTVGITHDVYLKMWQLTKPQIENVQLLFLDEFQDSNEVTLDIFFNQKCQKIAVGDPLQGIYEWRGAINAFDKVPEDFVTLQLSESFRFTQDIADATKWFLQKNCNEIIKLQGKADKKTLKADCYIEEKFSGTFVEICRTNATIIGKILEAYENKQKVHINFNVKDIWKKLWHLSAVSAGKVPQWPDYELLQYKTYRDIVAASKTNPELAKFLTIYQKLSKQGLAQAIKNIESCLVEEESDADVILTTAHKSKGLEWDRVKINSDMFYLREEETIEEFLNRDQNKNLLYVALTRAKLELILPAEALEFSLPLTIGE